MDRKRYLPVENSMHEFPEVHVRIGAIYRIRATYLGWQHNMNLIGKQNQGYIYMKKWNENAKLKMLTAEHINSKGGAKGEQRRRERGTEEQKEGVF